MFSVAPLHPLHNGILELVARHPEMTIADLHRELLRSKKTATSLQHVYRIVTKMTEEQILVKMKGKVSLNQMWISYLAFYAERSRKASAEAKAGQTVPLREGERRRFIASSLLEVETIWNHLLVELYRGIGAKTLHKYYSHAWWLLGKHARDVSFYKELSDRGIRCLWLFGNDTPLDRHGADRLQSVFPSAITVDPPFPKEGYNLNVYGDCILECLFPEKLQQELSSFFAKTPSSDAFDHEHFLDLFSQPARCTVTVWRNARQAEVLRGKIEPFVGEHGDGGQG
jgi:hypothetical protein